MDSYNRGYNAGIEGLVGTQIGTATIEDESLPDGSEAAGFYAVAYETQYGTVISTVGRTISLPGLT